MEQTIVQCRWEEKVTAEPSFSIWIHWRGIINWKTQHLSSIIVIMQVKIYHFVIICPVSLVIVIKPVKITYVTILNPCYIGLDVRIQLMHCFLVSTATETEIQVLAQQLLPVFKCISMCKKTCKRHKSYYVFVVVIPFECCVSQILVPVDDLCEEHCGQIHSRIL